MSQFTTTRSNIGDMNVNPGSIIDLTAATTAVFGISPGSAETPIDQTSSSATSLAPRFAGGSSRNMVIEEFINANIPSGWFKQVRKYQWASEDGDFTIDIAEDGSLTWSDATDVILTAPAGSIPIDNRITCSSLVMAGGLGNSEFIVDLGTATGTVDLDFDAYTVPDIFIVEYDGVEVINSGYRGVDGTYDGPNGPEYITVDGPGLGTLSFTKSNATPESCIVKVIAPFLGTAWELTVSCPGAAAPPYTPASIGRSTFTATSTAYGDTLNGGTPFTLDVIFEGGYPLTRLLMTSEPLGGPFSFFQQTVTQWFEEFYNSFRVDIDENGEATISDHAAVVAIRPTVAGFEQYLDPTGSYEATEYGRNTYNLGGDFFISIQMELTAPQELYVYLLLSLTAGSITGVQGPFSAPTLPANTAGVKVLPISYSDGNGNVYQYNEGAILWK